MDYANGTHEEDVACSSRVETPALPPPSLDRPLPPLPPLPQHSTKREYKLSPELADTDFRKEFPPDTQIGSELDEAARVWKVYRKEAEAFDNGLLQGWSDTLDILLIFAGLFSAVATAFVIESYQLLELDNTAYTAAALYILVVASNHSTGMTLPSPPDISYGSPLSRWINGLWFTSLLLSLAVALLAILAKQWITEYRARNYASAKSPRDWARRREVYFRALNSWPVAEIVAILPFLLHLSLFLFLAGVIAFLWTLDQSIGIWIIILGAFLGFFYMGCTLAPLLIPESPTSTPLVKQLRPAALPLILSGLKACRSALVIVQRLRSAVILPLSLDRSKGRSLPITTSLRDRGGHRLSSIAGGIPTLPSEVHKHFSISQFLDRAIDRATSMHGDNTGIQRLMRNCDQLDASALQWLMVEVSDSDAVAVGIQALGALHPCDPRAALLRADSRVADFADMAAFTRSASGHSSSEVLRVVRSVLCMCRRGECIRPERVRCLDNLDDTNYPDIALLRLRPQDIATNAIAWRAVSPSLASTALHAFRAQYHERSPVYLLCCDLDRFSDAEWDLAVDAAECDIDVRGVVDFAKPLRLSVVINERFRDEWSDEWIDQLLYHVLKCVPRAPDTDTMARHNLLSASAVRFIASKQFCNLKLDMVTLKRLASYFRFDVDIPARCATSASIVQFWRAFACVVDAEVSSGSLASFDWDDHARTCAHALRLWPRTEETCSAVLDGFLLPHPFALHAKSLWGMLSKHSDRQSLMLLEVADALAAYVSISTRYAQQTTHTADWIARFFAELSDDSIISHAWVDGRSGARPGSRRSEVLVHLIQHAAELGPQWLRDILSREQRRIGPSRNGLLRLIHDEASRRGSCNFCPDYLGYLRYLRHHPDLLEDALENSSSSDLLHSHAVLSTSLQHGPS